MTTQLFTEAALTIAYLPALIIGAAYVAIVLGRLFDATGISKLGGRS